MYIKNHTNSTMQEFKLAKMIMNNSEGKEIKELMEKAGYANTSDSAEKKLLMSTGLINAMEHVMIRTGSVLDSFISEYEKREVSEMSVRELNESARTLMMVYASLGAMRQKLVDPKGKDKREDKNRLKGIINAKKGSIEEII